MKKIELFNWIILALFAGCSCSSVTTGEKYIVKSVEGVRIEMDSSLDKQADPRMTALLNLYKEQLDAEMNMEIGTAARTLVKGYPQSLLSNFTADAIREFAAKEWGDVDFAVMNNGGLRASLNKGAITVGNLYEIYPFENRIIFLEVPGKAIRELFNYFAFNGGEGLSSGVRLVIRDRAIASLQIGGKPVDDERIYRVATIDYLAEGNSGMEALTHAVKQIETGKTLREVMIEHVRTKTAQNSIIDAKLDDRIRKE